MNLLTGDRNILFLRVPKCGSTYTRKHMVEDLLPGKRRVVHALQDKAMVAWQDFRRPQLDGFVDEKNLFLSTEYFAPLGTTFNRFAPHWYPEQARSPAEAATLFDRFKAAGWFMFSFVRSPGDLLCSMYHYGKDTPRTQRWYFKRDGAVDHHFYWFRPEESLDEFIGRDPLPLPRLYFDWRQLDYIRPFSPKNYSEFCRAYFGIELDVTAPENKSSNQGYEHYCRIGAISAANQRRIRESAYAAVYDEIAAAAAQ